MSVSRYSSWGWNPLWTAYTPSCKHTNRNQMSIRYCLFLIEHNPTGQVLLKSFNHTFLPVPRRVSWIHRSAYIRTMKRKHSLRIAKNSTFPVSTNSRSRWWGTKWPDRIKCFHVKPIEKRLNTPWGDTNLRKTYSPAKIEVALLLRLHLQVLFSLLTLTVLAPKR